MPRKRHTRVLAGNFGYFQALVTDEEAFLDCSFGGFRGHVVSKTSEFGLVNLGTQENWSLLAKKK